jgi:PST family polysaccharide transporter
MSFGHSRKMIAKNLSWLFLDRVIKSTLGIAISMWVARYLKPEQFGLLSYASAYVSLFGALATLGLNEVVTRDLILHPKKSDEIISTALLMQLTAGVVSFFLIIFSLIFLKNLSNNIAHFIIILGFGAVFQCGGIFKCYFESKTQSSNAVIAENLVFLLLVAIKILLIVNSAPLEMFVIVAAIESIVVMVGLAGIYILKVGFNWAANGQLARRMIVESWPIVLSGIAISIYMRIDQVMLGSMIGEKAVGIYASAVRISELMFFFPGIVVASVYPSIIKLQKNPKKFKEKSEILYGFLAGTSIFGAIFVFIFAKDLVLFFYGNNYLDAVQPLRILAFTSIFVSFGAAWSREMVLKGRFRIMLFFQIAALLMNVFLNTILIPTYGINGAAIATLVSYGMGHTILASLFKSQHESLVRLIKSVLFFWVKNVFNKKAD